MIFVVKRGCTWVMGDGQPSILYVCSLQQNVTYDQERKRLTPHCFVTSPWAACLYTYCIYNGVAMSEINDVPRSHTSIIWEIHTSCDHLPQKWDRLFLLDPLLWWWCRCRRRRCRFWWCWCIHGVDGSLYWESKVDWPFFLRVHSVVYGRNDIISFFSPKILLIH